MDKQFEDQLSRFVDGKVCVMGIGNRHLHDDGVGSFVAEALESSPELEAVDAGFIPEYYLEKVASKHPDTILMVDATDFGGEPGQVALIYPDKVAYSKVSTQAGSLRMLAEYMSARTHAPVALLAIQPEDISEGEDLSPPVSSTFKELLETLPAICGKHRNFDRFIS